MPLVHTLMRFIKVRCFVIEVTTSAVKLAQLRKKKSAEFKINNREGEELMPHMQSGFDLCLDFTQDTW